MYVKWYGMGYMEVKSRMVWKIVFRRIIEKVMGDWLGRFYFGCKWSRRIDEWIEELIYKLNDEWFVE